MSAPYIQSDPVRVGDMVRACWNYEENALGAFIGPCPREIVELKADGSLMTLLSMNRPDVRRIRSYIRVRDAQGQYVGSSR